MTRVLESTERQEVRDTQLPDVRGSLSNRVSDRFSADQRALAGEILSPLARCQLHVRRDRHRASAPAAQRTTSIRFSSPSARARSSSRAATSIDELATEKLNAFGLLDPQPDPARAVGWLLLATLTVVLLLGWIWRFRPQIWHRTPALLLIALVLIVTVLAHEGDRRSVGAALRRSNRGRGSASGRPARRRRRADRDRHASRCSAAQSSAMSNSPPMSSSAAWPASSSSAAASGLTHFVQAAIAIAIVNVLVVSVFTLAR